MSFGRVVLEDHPILWLRLGDTASPAIDEIGSNDGVAEGNVNFGVAGLLAGDPDKAVQFPASPGKIVIPEHVSLHTGNTLSIEYVAERTRHGIGIEYVTVKAGNGEWYTAFSGGENPYFGVNGSPGGFRSAGTVIEGAPHIIAFTKDGPTVHAYLDGVESTVDDGTVTVSHATPSDIWLSVGTFVGKLDEFSLYDYALSPERAAIHAAEFASPTPDSHPFAFGTIL